MKCIKRATNCQIVRAMSEKKFAEWLEERGATPPNCDKEHINVDNKKCRDCWIKWMKQEATE